MMRARQRTPGSTLDGTSRDHLLDTALHPIPAAALPRRILLAMGGAAWLAAVASGLWLMLRFDLAPGAPGDPPFMWPRESRLERVTGTPTLVVVLHPRCPCSRATLGELELLLGRASDHLRTHVLFVAPAGVGSDWRETDLWRQARSIPGVMVSHDEGAAETRRFRVATSGHVLVYDRNGALAFSGGITSSRGHAGANLGRSAIDAIASGGAPDTRTAFVYGCPLSDPPAAAGEGRKPCCR
jgi:hypothetical protein